MRVKASDLPPEVRASLNIPAKGKARFKRHKPGEMNETEKAFSERLEQRLLSGEIMGYWFECIKLKLADNTFYTPDFFVVLADGTAEFWEVKALWKNGSSWQDDAKVKSKVAIDKFWPFVFRVAYGRKLPKKAGGGWEWKEE